MTGVFADIPFFNIFFCVNKKVIRPPGKTKWSLLFSPPKASIQTVRSIDIINLNIIISFRIYCCMANTAQLRLFFAIYKALSVLLINSSIDDSSDGIVVLTPAISFIQ